MIVILVSVNFILCIGVNVCNKVYMKYRILFCVLEKSVYDIKNLKISVNYNENCIFIYMWGIELIIIKRISYYCYFFIIYIVIISSIIYFIFVY